MQKFNAVLFVCTVLASAFLLFQVQPMLARYVLPWFGGTPAVWTVCMLFFQVFLFLGYAYAHFLQKFFKIHWQAAIHVGLLLFASIFLPIEPDPIWRDFESSTPVFALLMLLGATVGIPYFLLSSTGPLLQVWFSKAHKDRSPYPLYAVSNLGSFVALLSYPFVFEPLLPVSQQVNLWSLGFGFFAVLCTILAIYLVRQKAQNEAVETDEPQETSEVTALTRTLWIGLPAVATLILLSVTNHITQDIAAIPLLWVIPLSLYLLTFILCFESDRWYRRKPFAFATLVVIVALALVDGVFQENWSLISVLGYNLLLFFAVMMCHGELAAMRPGTDKLTSFYLSLAGGGALGGIFVGLIAPMIFTSYVELEISFVVILALIFIANRQNPRALLTRANGLKLAAGGVAGFALIVVVIPSLAGNTESYVQTSRNFYGVLKQSDYIDEQGRNVRRLVHGRIVHGMQFLDKGLKRVPTSYYGSITGVGRIMAITGKESADTGTPRKIGVVGLGAGTLSTYGKRGDTMQYYEINPAITQIARNSFDYISSSPADVSIVHGDALISMEKEALRKYDILVLDAFSGDAIPVHLLTVEAFRTYLSHVREGGAISVHISNNYFDLKSVVWALADQFDLQGAYINSPVNLAEGTTAAQWVILSTDRALIKSLEDDPNFEARDLARETNLWTNDFSNVLKVMKLFNP
jgi:hypothetical protein